MTTVGSLSRSERLHMNTLDDLQPAVPEVPRARGHARLVGAGLLAATIGIVATILVAASTVAVLPGPLVVAGSLAASLIGAGWTIVDGLFGAGTGATVAALLGLVVGGV